MLYIFFTCLAGISMLFNSLPERGSTCKTRDPLKTATHKFPSVSIVIPSGTPGTPNFSKSKMVLRLAKISKN